MATEQEELHRAIFGVLGDRALSPAQIYEGLPAELRARHSARAVAERLYILRREGALQAVGAGRSTRYKALERREQQQEQPPAVDRRRGRRYTADNPPSWAHERHKKAQEPAQELEQAPAGGPGHELTILIEQRAQELERQALELAQQQQLVDRPPAHVRGASAPPLHPLAAAQLPPLLDPHMPDQATVAGLLGIVRAQAQAADLADLAADALISLGRSVYAEAAEQAERAERAARACCSSSGARSSSRRSGGRATRST